MYAISTVVLIYMYVCIVLIYISFVNHIYIVNILYKCVKLAHIPYLKIIKLTENFNIIVQ